MIAAVLIRGLLGTRHEIKDALASINLQQKHTCVILKDTPQIRGVLNRCKDMITFGEITPEIQKLLDEKRGQKDQDGKLKPFYRLHPPRGGFERKGIKKSFTEGGVLGNRGAKMDDLIKRMI